MLVPLNLKVSEYLQGFYLFDGSGIDFRPQWCFCIRIPLGKGVWSKAAEFQETWLRGAPIQTIASL